MKHNTELLHLLSKLCSRELDDAQSRTLAEMLHRDPQARQAYIEYVDLHAALAWEASSAAELEHLLPVEAANSSDPCPPGGLPLGQRAANLFVGSRVRVALTVASSFLLVLLVALAVAPAPLFRFQGPVGDALDDRVIAGRITGSVDCVWQDATLPLGYGSSLYKGQQIELHSGTAEVTFAGGAIVTLRGPAAYVIDSESRSSLRHGELSAFVPRRAQGFAVQTPAALIVDRGTRFGVVVEQTGSESESAPIEELHVFEGAVDLSLRDSSAPPRRLEDSAAVRIRPDGKLETLAASQPGRFPAEIADEGDTTTADPLPEEAYPPVTNGLALWLAADGAIRTDERRRVSVWEDMLAGDNRKAQNANQHLAQHRPLLVANSIGGRPALRFDGDDTLTLATPSSFAMLNSSYEVFIVARSASPAIQFLIAGGVEDFEMHLNGDAGVRFIPAGFDASADASDFRPASHFSDGRAHLFSARVTATDFCGIVAVDGRDSADTVTHDCRCSNNTSLRLGMRHDASFCLQGEIAEVLIYNTELSPGDRASVGDYLANKYTLHH